MLRVLISPVQSIEELHQTLAGLLPGLFLGITSTEQETFAELAAEPTSEQLELLSAAVSDQLSAEFYRSIVTNAAAFGAQLIASFAADNVRLGITQAGMTTTVRLATADVTSALQTGSLYDAISAAKAIPSASYDSTFITASRILAFVNKIEDYLGIPRSTSL